MTRAHPRGWWCLVMSSALAMWFSGCTHDVVIPGEVTATSADAAGAGDVALVCADGGVDAGSTCEDLRSNAACDLSGFWAVRETTYLLDQVFQTVQVSSNWYLYEISQTGSAFSLDASLDCGVHVTGSATIDYPAATEQALVWLNP